jgi:hypothetical protein
MGLLEFGANVLLRMKADTTQAKAALKDLSGEEKKAAQAAIDHAEKTNKAIERKAKAWQFAAQAVGGVTAAYAVGKSGLEAYAKTSEHAAAQVTKIKDASGKAFDSLMASVGKAVAGLEPLITGVASLVSKLSEVGVAGPAAIGALALAVTGNPVIAGIVAGGAWAASGPHGSGGFLRAGGDFSKWAKGIEETNRLEARGGYERQYGVDNMSGDISRVAVALGDAFVVGLNRVGITTWSPFNAKSRGARESNILDPDNVAAYGLRRNVGGGSADEGVGSRAFNNGLIDAQFNEEMARQSRAFQQGSRGLMSPYAAQGSGIASAQESQLSRMFGPLDEFNAYAAAFDTLSGAIGSALSAWIDGSMSAGKAFKAFIGEAVKGLAVQMTIESLKHGAYAIGSLAMGNVAGAALHGKAAAGFAVGALAAAAAAKGLHAGGAPAGGTGGVGASAPRALGGTPGGSGGTNITIVYGDALARNSPHEQQLEAQRLVRLGFETSRQAVKAR